MYRISVFKPKLNIQSTWSTSWKHKPQTFPLAQRVPANQHKQ